MAIYATRYIGPMRNGYCKPQLFECSDGNMYVVKFMSNPQGLRILPNELIAYRLGRLLNLPVVANKVIVITHQLLEENPQLNGLVQTGPHIGSLYFPQSTHASKNEIPQCNNLSEVPKFMVYDFWINNDDRYNSSANFIIDKSSQSKIHLIDHGSCFCGPGWTIKKLNRKFVDVKPYWGEMSKRFLPFIDGPSPFDTALGELELLTKDQIKECTLNIPKEWKISDEELDCLVGHLDMRKGLVRLALEEIRPRFPIWSNTPNPLP